MSRKQRRIILTTMLFAWPLAIAIGAVLNQITRSHAPMTMLPIVWLFLTAHVIERMHMEH